jgi:hypothetical protein
VLAGEVARELGGVVVLVIGGIVLGLKLARVSAAGSSLVVATEAVLVASTIAGDVRALLAEGLIIGHIGGEATDLVKDAKCLHRGGKLAHVIGPANPTTVCGVEIHGDRRGRSIDSVDGVWDASSVGSSGGSVAAVRVGLVSGEVGERIGFDHKSNRHFAFILLEYPHKRGDVFVLVLSETIIASASSIVVASAVSIIGAADFPVGSLGVAVTIGKVVDDEDAELRGGFGGRVGKDSLEAVGAGAVKLALDIKPIGGGHVAHRLKGRFYRASGGGDRGVQLCLECRINIVWNSSERVAAGAVRGKCETEQCRKHIIFACSVWSVNCATRSDHDLKLPFWICATSPRRRK